MMQLTVAVCTYLRARLLARTLESLAACARPALEWELLVVDNAAEDPVRSLAADWSDRLPLRYTAATTLGTSHARNHAVRAARAPIVLFTDDDVTFHPDWLVRMAEAINGHDECAFWGGRVEPVWSDPPPAWFDADRCPMLADTIVQYRRGGLPRAWRPAEDPPFYTANLALRAESVAACGYFDTTVGHQGAARMGMEDSLMVHAIAGRGGRGWYAADAVVYHPVPGDRLTRTYARRFAWRQGWLSARVHRPPGRRRPPRWFYRVAASQLAAGVARWLRGLAGLDPGAAFAGQFLTIYNLSRLRHARGTRPWTNNR